MIASPEFPTIDPSLTGWPWTPVDFDMPTSVATWPKVSIVMPSLNQIAFIEQAIRSVLLQDYPNLELIISDGGSSDGSVDVIKKYSAWIDYWVSEPDDGQSAALNKGFRLASGDILAWLNSDDLYLPGCLFKMAERMLHQPQNGLLIGQVGVINGENRRMGTFEPVDYSFEKLLRFEQIFPQQAAFFRKGVLDSVGDLREDLHYAMDHEFFVRIAMNQIPITFVEEEMALFRISGRNKGSADRSKWASEFERIADSILSSGRENSKILMDSGRIRGGAAYRGADTFYDDEQYATSRAWLIKALKANGRYIYKAGWWKRFLLSYAGKWGSDIVFHLKKSIAAQNKNSFPYDWDYNSRNLEENMLNQNAGSNDR